MTELTDQFKANFPVPVANLTQLLKIPIYKASIGTIAAPDRIAGVSSSLFNPVASNLIFEAQTIEDADGNSIDLPELIIDRVLMTASLKKNIIKTPVQGLNGTIKEYIADMDYTIRIAGAFDGRNPNKYPAQEVADLIQILSASNPLRVASSYLQRFSIHDIVVESFTFPEERGSRNTQSFLINAISDLPPELREVEERIIAG